MMKADASSIITICFTIFLLFPACEKEPETVTDIDGNEYPTVSIGTQVWMAENLKVTRLNDGTDIPYVTHGIVWQGLTTPAYCYYDKLWSNRNLYGALYNWYTVNTKKLCPTGWHVPTNGEWTTLFLYLGGDTLVGGKLKDTGTAYWESPNMGATNETGFSARGGGLYQGSFDGIKECAYFWSSSEYQSHWGYYVGLFSSTSNPLKGHADEFLGMSVRCVRN